MNYTSFVDDLIFRMDEYNKSFKSDSEEVRFSIHQQQQWAPNGRRKAISQKTLGYDDENCLRLLTECGYDGQPVSSQTSSTVRKWFEYTNGHVFPPQKDVLRLALFFNLDFYTLLHWVLKSDFEQFFVEKSENWQYLCGLSLQEIIDEYNNFENNSDLNIELENFHQQLNTDMLFRLFENHWQLASAAGYNRQLFSDLINDIFREKLLLYPNQSQKISNFAEYQETLIEQAQYGTPEDQDTLWRKRGIWLMLQDELDTAFIEIENTRLKNAETEQAYLRLFGESIISQTELEMEIQLLEIRLYFMRVYPGISEEELAQKILETQEKLEKDMADLRLKEALARDTTVMQAWKETGVPMETDALEKEKELCKAEIREIRKLVHPDILMNNPEYANLSEEQKQELEEILLDALKISPSELGFPPNFAYHDMRSLEGLRQVRKRVETILKMNKIRVDLQYQIEGETIHEQISWLEQEIILLENRLNAAKGQHTAMLADHDMQLKKALLRNTERQSVFAEKMKAKITELTEKRDQLLAEMQSL